MDISKYITSSPELDTIKNKAKEAFASLVMPTKKNEDWKYTKIKALFPEAHNLPTKESVSADAVNALLVKGLDAHKVVFVNGIWVEDLSDCKSANYTILPLTKAITGEHKTLIASKLGQIASSNEISTVLNIATMQEGLFVHIAKNIVADKPLQVIHINTGNGVHFTPMRNLFLAEQCSELSIVEKIQNLSSDEALNNNLTEISISKNANFRLYKVQNDTLKTNLVDNTYVYQEGDSFASINTFSFGGNITRNTLLFDQDGENIDSTLNGISIIKGEQEVGSHTLVKHNTPNCESHEMYKGIFDEKSHGIFNGKILVDQIAQKTNAFQQNNSILLSDEASIDTKPQLEIFADDVKCSHGCTIGQLDDEAMFYLNQRGIPTKEAKALLMYAFTAEVMNSVTLPELKQELNKIIAKKLEVNIDFDF